MFRNRIAVLLLLPLFLVTTVHADEGCDEYFEVGSGPAFTSFGAQPAGGNHGQGQTFTLNCGSKLMRAAFNFTWGNDCGDVRALAYGDTIHFSVLNMAGEELVRDGVMLDSSLSTRTITWYFHNQEVLLPAGTYAAVCWTDADACGGIRYRTEDLVAGSHYLSDTATNFTTWSTTTGEIVSTIVVDSDVTPAETTDWSTLKAQYR